jgi:hypothetical protein
MSSRPFRFVLEVVRTWTRLYTSGMPPVLRDSRRAEIESDLWEFQRDPAAMGGSSPTIHILVRMVIGILADLCWRWENTVMRRNLIHAVVAFMATTLIVIAVAALYAMRVGVLPPPPTAPALDASTIRAPAPPPLPPPPPRHAPAAFTAGFGR